MVLREIENGQIMNAADCRPIDEKKYSRRNSKSLTKGVLELERKRLLSYLLGREL